MLQNLLPKKAAYPCESVSVEALDNLILDVYSGLTGNGDRLKSCLSKESFENIPWEHLRHWRMIGDEDTEYLAYFETIGITRGFYLNADSTWLLLILPKQSSMDDYLAHCGSNVQALSLWNTPLDLQNIVNIPRLKALHLRGNSTLANPDQLAMLPELTQLTVADCPRLTALPGLERLEQLTELHFSECDNLAVLSGLENLTRLTKLTVSECSSLTEMPELGKLTQLTELTVSASGKIANLPSLENLTHLTALTVSDCPRITALPSLENLANLTRLDLSWCRNLAALPGLEKLTKLTRLDLSWCRNLNALPELRNLSQLTELKLSGFINISELPWLGKLTRLTELTISDCGLLTAVPGLENLTQLTHLDLSDCRGLTALPELHNLRQLTKLNLFWCCQLSALPGLEKLTRLTDLNLSGLGILTELPELGNLSQLTRLNLTDCSCLAAIPGLEKLTQLTYLNLTNCRSLTNLAGLEHISQLQDLSLSGCTGISALPPAIHSMKSLRRLRIRNLNLRELPDWLPEIAECFVQEKYGAGYGTTGAAVELYDTTVDGVDMSIFNQPYEIVLKWFEERKKGRTQCLNEIKVIFLGDGEVGKTYTISRLMNDGGDAIDYKSERTPGIEIKSKFSKYDNREFTVNYWDFGGQEIMHSMHRIFLTNRTMYVVLVSALDPDPNERARYWLSNIKSFAPNAPVLLALNKIDIAPHVSLDAAALQDENRNLTQVVRLCSHQFDRPEFDREFRHVLLREIIKTGMLDAEWPKSWIAVKNRLENIGKHHIPIKDYKRICNECHAEDVHMELLHWFNDLGVSFCFRNNHSLKHQVILQPKWITNGLYIILFNKCSGIVNGMVPHASIHDLLENAPKDESIQCTDRSAEYEIPRDAEYVLGIMREFGLSLCVNSDTEFIPMLCQDHPMLDLSRYKYSENVLEFHMVFEHLPNNLLHRLMVERYSELDQSSVWKNGARFSLPGTGLSAVIAKEGNTLKFYISHTSPSHQPKTYLTILRTHADRIWQQMGLQAPEEALVYKHGSKIGIFDYEELKYALSHGRKEIYAKSFKRSIPIADILRRSGLEESSEYHTSPLSSESLPSQNAAYSSINEHILLGYIVQSCVNIQAEPSYGSTGDRSGKEDLRNRRIRDDLKLRLEKSGYQISDQPQRGRSKTGQSVGELDLLLENPEGIPWTAIEALRIRDNKKTDWEDHLLKLLGGYNYAGLHFAYLLTYVDASETEFMDIWDKYPDHIRNYHPGSYTCKSGTYQELNTSQDPQYIRKVKCEYTCGVARITVYHLFVMVKPQPPKPNPSSRTQ